MKKSAISQFTADRILNDEISLYGVLTDEVTVLDGEMELLQSIASCIAIDYGLNPDDDYEKVLDILRDEIAADFE